MIVFIRDSEKNEIPIRSIITLEELVRAGRLDSSTLVRSARSRHWIKAESEPVIAKLLTSIQKEADLPSTPSAPLPIPEDISEKKGAKNTLLPEPARVLTELDLPGGPLDWNRLSGFGAGVANDYRNLIIRGGFWRARRFAKHRQPIAVVLSSQLSGYFLATEASLSQEPEPAFWAIQANYQKEVYAIVPARSAAARLTRSSQPNMSDTELMEKFFFLRQARRFDVVEPAGAVRSAQGLVVIKHGVVRWPISGG